MSSPEEIARDFHQQKMKDMYEQQNRAAGVLTGPLLLPSDVPRVCDVVEPSPPALARYWQLDKFVNTLQEANRIRRDEALMKEIRMYLRMKKEEASNLIDEIG